MKKLNNRYKKKSLTFKFIAFCISVFYKKSEYIGLENLPEEPCIIAGNHAKLNGPINSELYFPTKKLIWCDGPMMDKKEFVGYAFETFFAGKPNFFQKILTNNKNEIFNYFSCEKQAPYRSKVLAISTLLFYSIVCF